MKKTLLIILISSKIFGQCLEKIYSSNPYLNIVNSTIVGQEFMNSKFDWTKPRFYRFDERSIPSLNPEFISPFYIGREGYTEHIFFSENSDFKPEDGWELIKQDFKVVNYDNRNHTQDTDSNKTKLVTLTKNGCTNVAQIPYIVLYNKYEGKIRVLIAITGNAYSNTAQDVVIEIYAKSGKLPFLFSGNQSILKPLSEPTYLNNLQI